jgi:hypothetical protein
VTKEVLDIVGVFCIVVKPSEVYHNHEDKGALNVYFGRVQ